MIRYNRKNKLINGNNGITLIALTLTIIVLIILAGVTITALTGENSIIKQANDANIETKIASVEEARDIWKTRKEDGVYSKTYSDVADELEKKNVLNNKEAEELRTKGFVTINGKKIVFDSENTSFDLLVNTGADGIVYIPVDVSTENVTVDWGDGIVDKLGSHKYSDLNTEKTVSIQGKINLIDSFYIPTLTSESNPQEVFKYFNKIKGISSWGDTGASKIYLQACDLSKGVASPGKNSFKNVVSFGHDDLDDIKDRGLFAGSNINSITDDFLDNAPNVEDFSYAFSDTQITSIPPNLFDKCMKVKSFKFTFYNCTKLSGKVPELWMRCSDNSNYDSGDPDGKFCYGSIPYEVTTRIPTYWKTGNNPV